MLCLGRGRGRGRCADAHIRVKHMATLVPDGGMGRGGFVSPGMDGDGASVVGGVEYAQIIVVAAR